MNRVTFFAILAVALLGGGLAAWLLAPSLRSVAPLACLGGAACAWEAFLIVMQSRNRR